MKTSELTGAALDWAVAKCEGWELKSGRWGYSAKVWLERTDSTGIWRKEVWEFTPSTDWSQGGPIIEREKIDLHHIGSAWTASIYAPKWHARDHEQFGPTPLIAAMRCFCCSKLGDEVDIPEELCQQQNN